MKNITHVAFDRDQTISFRKRRVDLILPKIIDTLRQKTGNNWFTRENIARILLSNTFSDYQSLGSIFLKHAEPAIVSAIFAKFDYIHKAEEDAGTYKPYNNTKKVLNRLKDSGYKIILISDADSVFARWSHHEKEIGGLFDHIYWSCDQGASKRNGLYDIVMKDLQVTGSEIMMIGNSLTSDCIIPYEKGIHHVVHLDRSIRSANTLGAYKHIPSLRSLIPLLCTAQQVA